MKQCRQCNKYLEKYHFGVYKVKGKKAYPCELCKSCNNDNINAKKRANYDPNKKHEYYLINKDKIKARTKARHYLKRKTDILYKIQDLIRNRTKKALNHRFWKKTTKFYEYIGCSLEELKIHLESQFTDGMTWNNQGKWEIDHILPLASAKTEEELYKLCHYTNLQPLWAIDNKRKGSKL